MLRAARLITNNGFISQKRKPLKYSIGNPTWKCSNELFSVFYSFPLPSFLAVSCLPIKAMQLDLRPLHTHTQGKDNAVHSKAHWCSLLSHGHLRPTLPSLPPRFISDGKGRWWDLFPPYMNESLLLLLLSALPKGQKLLHSAVVLNTISPLLPTSMHWLGARAVHLKFPSLISKTLGVGSLSLRHYEYCLRQKKKITTHWRCDFWV